MNNISLFLSPFNSSNTLSQNINVYLKLFCCSTKLPEINIVFFLPFLLYFKIFDKIMYIQDRGYNDLIYNLYIIYQANSMSFTKCSNNYMCAHVQ